MQNEEYIQERINTLLLLPLFVLLMLPIKTMYDNVLSLSLLTPSLLFCLRVVADKMCYNKELNICKHTMINKHVLWTDLPGVGGGI